MKLLYQFDLHFRIALTFPLQKHGVQPNTA